MASDDWVDRDYDVVEFREDDFPKSTSDYDSSTTPYSPATGKGSVADVAVDVSAVVKNSVDAVTKVAKTVADITNAKTTDEKKPDSTPPTKSGSTPPAPSPVAKPTATGSGSGAAFGLVAGVLGISVLGAAFALRSSRKRRAL